jgi:hypothetical protein
VILLWLRLVIKAAERGVTGISGDLDVVTPLGLLGAHSCDDVTSPSGSMAYERSIDVGVHSLIDDVKSASEWDGCWRCVGGQEGREQAVVNFGIEERHPQVFGSQEVAVRAREASDEAAEAKAAQVVAHL